MFCAYRLNIKTRFHGNALEMPPTFLSGLKKLYNAERGDRNPQIYDVTARSVEEPSLGQCSKMLNKNKIQRAWNGNKVLFSG
jgi:hypothetical protein